MSLSTCPGFRHALEAVTMSPAVEKTRSTGSWRRWCYFLFSLCSSTVHRGSRFEPVQCTGEALNLQVRRFSVFLHTPIVHLWYCLLLNVVMPRRSDGTLNRGPLWVHMHLRTCVDQKEPGWPSESLGVQKHTDMADT